MFHQGGIMMIETITYKNGKVFRNIDFQIMLRKEKIKVLQTSIKKVYKLAGINGPNGTDNMGIDYSRVNSSTPVTHIGLNDAGRLAESDIKQIKKLQNEIVQLRNRKRKLIKILKSLDGLEEQIFYRRVIMCDTQEEAAEAIGISRRHLQRIEKQMKENSISFDN